MVNKGILKELIKNQRLKSRQLDIIIPHVISAFNYNPMFNILNRYKLTPTQIDVIIDGYYDKDKSVPYKLYESQKLTSEQLDKCMEVEHDMNWESIYRNYKLSSEQIDYILVKLDTYQARDFYKHHQQNMTDDQRTILFNLIENEL